MEVGTALCPNDGCGAEIPWELDGGDMSVSSRNDRDRPACPKCGIEVSVDGVDYAVETVYLGRAT